VEHPERPIFIVGAPRSGTTLVASILAAHPRIAISPETRFLSQLLPDVPVDARGSVEAMSALAGRICGPGHLQVAELDAGSLVARVVAERIDDPHRFFSLLLDEVKRQTGKPRIGEKTPDHDLHAETLLAWYPDCRILWMVRDPRALLASSRKVPFRYVSNPRGVAHRWLRSVEALERLSPRDARILSVRYEDLVGEPSREGSRIFEFVGERFDPALLNAERPRYARPHTPWHEAHQDRARAPVDRASLGRWKEELRPEEITLLELAAGRALGRWGYSRASSLRGCLRLARLVAARVLVGRRPDWTVRPS